MNKIAERSAMAPATRHTAALLDRLASTLGCPKGEFFKDLPERHDQTSEMHALWNKLSSTKDREDMLAVMRARVSVKSA